MLKGQLMFNVPINSITWTLGFIALYTFALKSWLTYRRTKNPLAKMYYMLGFSFGTAVFFFGVPGLFTQNLHTLLCAYFVADFFTQLSFQIQVWLLWFIGLRNHVRLRYLLACTIPLSVAILVLEIFVVPSRVMVDQSPYLIAYADQLPVLILKTIIYITIPLPLGYFFLRQAPSQTTLSAKLKSLIIGSIFIVIAALSILNNILGKGSDTVQSSIGIAIFFVIFFIVQLLRPVSKTSR